ncbi:MULTISPECIES: RtcB family protein [unclassified Brevibacterium]|uniref:RtcB family protein n=1 Tax=unclassified Brevibacterium TaxID=2614124 RepID=UPI001E39F5FF|nr:MULTISPECIES: RtcB family protein [unclassified Brevibacterium]MCD1286506.1 RNA-splicing ligase RtcB [Brevibacterium sp. CCUG 69071]MDK8434261.1 RtcB family protein [Brevibacterium sp. H-BE7]
MNQLAPKLYNWASILEDDTKNQALATSVMPFVHPHLALMPDAHLGKGATVGSVIPTDGAIMPAAVGVDIGCGMIAVRTQWTGHDFYDVGGVPAVRKLREIIESRVPLSAGNYNTVMTDTAHARRVELLDLWDAECRKHHRDLNDYATNWDKQLGTLGSGNHFIEITLDEESRVWAFLHSGSRGIGNKIAQHHIKVAQDVAKKYWIDLPDKDLAYLVEGTPEFDHYIAELGWAQHFALLNREEMMDRVLEALATHMGAEVEETQRINCHHNFTQKEHHFGRNLWISRKGAISAREGQLGLIPGSMGTASYVVEGLGNKMSFNSSPHGAGRNFSRSKARKTFTHEQLREAMKGIEYRDTDAFIDEIPQAYKDIDQVMDDASDLVKIRHTFHQVVNVKGD